MENESFSDADENNPEASKQIESKSCPRIEPMNNNLLELPYEERLSHVEQEVQSLYEFCLEKKFDQKQMYNCMSGMYGLKKSAVKKIFDDSFLTMLILSTIIGTGAMLVAQPSIWTFICANSRLLTLKLLPLWDWSKVYEEDCFIDNPWFQKDTVNVTADYCEYCKHKKIEKLNNIASMFVSDLVSYSDFHPFIATDSITQMKVKEMSMEELIEIYTNHPLLSSKLGNCIFQNNVEYTNEFYEFFKAFREGILPQKWHASWVNCDAKAAKFIRRYHSRPYFLPAMMQLETENIIIACKGEDRESSFTLPMDANEIPQGMVVSVLFGSLRFNLEPNEECVEKFGCSKVNVDILPGETLFYFVDYWTATYTPTNDWRTIAVANSVGWDEM